MYYTKGGFIIKIPMKILSALILCGALIVPVASADGIWTTQVIDGMRGEDVGKYCSLKIDTTNRPHILYYSETDQSLKYAWQPWVNISSWKWTTLVKNNGRWGSFWIDNKGNDFAFSCVNSSGALFVGTGYFRQGIRDSSFPQVSRMILVSSYGLFRETTLVNSNRGSWSCAAVYAYNAWMQEQGGSLSRIAMECCQPSEPQTCPGRPYMYDEVTPWYHGDGYSAVLRDPDNWNSGHAVCYYNSTPATLEYVSWGDIPPGGISSIPTEVVDGGAPASPAGRYCSLAIDSDGYPHIGYQGWSDGSSLLKYAWKDASGGHNVTVDSTAGLVEYISLTLGHKDVPHISYVVAGNNLKYATLNESVWHVELVENAPAVWFLWTSIETDNRGRPRIAYYDSTNGDLKFAWWESSIRGRPFR